MRVYLIRHAESEHNVAQVYAGVTDSALTNHGMLQIERLARHFRAQGVQFTRVFASPLQRARLTAEGLCKEPNASSLQPILLPVLMEKDFGSLEGESWRTSTVARSTLPPTLGLDHKEPESVASMAARANQFRDDFLLPLLYADLETTEVVAIVSHGIVLSVLWETLTTLCQHDHLVYSATVQAQARRPGWSNTGYMELDILKAAGGIARHISCNSPPENSEARSHSAQGARVTDSLSTITLKITVHTVNCRQHLQNLRRTGSGIGSAAYDPKQKRINNFFVAPGG
uniref:Phosphoglycerate mutase family protein n=1 Tax=Coccidioides posadasii RMSCC 3488 TaxID=454284 RepID=A0A0J6FCT4_COCPO|nr:hypothetical protein CPAG_07172 [Coccidioides posadasii RMSCC 3488]